MSVSRELYAILGLPENCTTEDIRRAYRRMAKRHHPDQGGDPDEFERIRMAHATLSDPEKRRRYDAENTYDPSQPDPEHVADLQLLGVLNQIIQNVVCGQEGPGGMTQFKDIATTDLIRDILRQLSSTESKIKASIRTTQERLRRNKEVTRRLRKKRRRKDSPDYLRMVLGGQREELRRVEVKLREDLARHVRVVQIFSGYGYAGDVLETAHRERPAGDSPRINWSGIPR